MSWQLQLAAFVRDAAAFPPHQAWVLAHDESGSEGTRAALRQLQNVQDLVWLLASLHGPLATGFFKPERRVELHPATDRWMMGDRYGEIVRVKDGLVHVKLDKSGKTFRFKPDDILHPGNRNP